MVAARTRSIQDVLARIRDIAYRRPHDADWYTARVLMGSSEEALFYAREQGLARWEDKGFDLVTWFWLRRHWGYIPESVGTPELLALRTPVTQEMWRRVMQTNPSAHRRYRCQACQGRQSETCPACQNARWRDLVEHPVEQVTWMQAVLFCNALALHLDRTPAYDICGGRVEVVRGAGGPRLPTEAEWERACLADASPYGVGRLRSVGTRPVMRQNANAWGLRGMLGNVWEWCWDEHPMDEDSEMRAVRGGSFLTTHPDPTKSECLPALTGWDDVGFRPVLPI